MAPSPEHECNEYRGRAGVGATGRLDASKTDTLLFASALRAELIRLASGARKDLSVNQPGALHSPKCDAAQYAPILKRTLLCAEPDQN